MKKPVLLSLSGAALFAAGYLVRDRMDGSPDKAQNTSPVASAVRERTASGHSSQPAKELANSGIRPFVPGRPFAKGHAREWLAGLVSEFGGNRRGDFVTLMNLQPVFLTMDGESVQEAMAAALEMSAIEDTKNPARRRNPNGDGKLDTLIMLTMMRMAQTNPEQAMEALKKNFNHNDGTTRALVFGRLAADDPQRAEQLALLLDKDHQHEGLEAVMYALSNKDPQAALDLAARHAGSVDPRHCGQILESWANRDPQTAMAAAVQEMAKSGNSEFVRNTIEEWCKKDLAAAAKWAAAHEGPGSVVARAMVLERSIKEDPQAALKEYAALQQAGGNPKDLARVTGALADALAGKDVSAAREWAQNLPSGDLRDRALNQVTKTWVKSDAPAASEWIRTLPSGQFRDGAARELSGALTRNDPASAFEWARSIENVKVREGALLNVVENWRERDADAANTALESLPMEMRPAELRPGSIQPAR
ncbi:MAG TPA: hypothetical protein VG796_17065 [Verrucomicrobiales bacterium]|nr:hypothetical protein [Verrucomicrobiales bacterium]